MIGTLLRFVFLRLIGARGAAILGIVAFLFGRRRRQRTNVPQYRRPADARVTVVGPEDRTTSR